MKSQTTLDPAALIPTERTTLPTTTAELDTRYWLARYRSATTPQEQATVFCELLDLIGRLS